MKLNFIRTTIYNNNRIFGFTLFNNSLYYGVPDGLWIYRYPLSYFGWVYVKTLQRKARSLTYVGKFFYAVSAYPPYIIQYDLSFNEIKAYPFDLSVPGSPVAILSVNGFFYVGFQMVSPTTYYIVKCNSKFKIIEYIHPGIANPNSMIYDGKYFYVTFDTNQTVYQYNSNFKLVSTSSSLGYQPTGLGYDGKFLYIWDTTNKYLKKYSVT